MSNDNNETKRVRTSNLNRKVKSKAKNSKSKNENGKKIKFKDKHPKASKAIKIGLIVFLLLIIIGSGILVGAFFGVFGEELKISEESLVIKHENSTVYDADGNLIATLSGGTKRKSISLSEMSEYLPKAYVAIEDERFYSHSGIDVLRTGRATVSYVLHGGKSSFGGSTITQQVIKNITQDKEKTAFAGALRKVKEISKAIQVEHYLSKDQILELYLNLIFTAGNDINGVELGSIYYFDKSAKDLSIAECAYMAGINHSPNAYKPFSDFNGDETKKNEMSEKIKKRTKTVLKKMKELSYINDEQYNQAVSEVDGGLHFQNGEGSKVTTDVSYVTEAAINQILDQMQAEQEDLSRDMAEMNLYSGGYKIYTTQKSDIQAIVEAEVVKEKYYKTTVYEKENKETGEKEKITQPSWPTIVIEDHKTGQVVAAATATGLKEERTAITKLGYFNIPTTIDKQTGSSMKPISVIAPGLITGKLSGATVYYNQATVWPKANGGKAWRPGNSTGYSDYSNMRYAIAKSFNIPHAKALNDIGMEAAVDFCKSVGLPDFSESGLSLALGGLNHGISPSDMAGAYSAIANDGVYTTQTYYTKVTDSKGNTVFEPKQEQNRVMSEQNAYIEKNILTETVVGNGGTATYCAIKGMDVAAKTGTTNADYDRWLCGFTNYYTAACWFGYEHSKEVKGFGQNPAGQIWAAVMKEIHSGLEGTRFQEPEGIVKQSVCRTSGKLPGAGCSDVYTELFTAETKLTETCEGHGVIRICNDTQQLATDFCPSVREQMGYIPERERNAPWVTEGMAQTAPEGTCTLHAVPVAPTAPVAPVDPTPTPTHTHTAGAWITDTPATETSTGLRHQECSVCKETIATEVIPVISHTHKAGAWITVTPATETTAGLKKQVCSVCGETMATEVIPAKGTTTNPDPNPNPDPDPDPNPDPEQKPEQKPDAQPTT